MPVKINSGDIWAYPADIRVNAVNCVGIMGRGIALEFKNRHPRMFAAYAKACRAGKLKPGEIFFWTEAGEIEIWNVSTKNHWRDQSQYDWIEQGIQSMKIALEHTDSKIMKVALPAIGCSNGGLDFVLVEKMIAAILESQPHEIALFPPLELPRCRNF